MKIHQSTIEEALASLHTSAQGLAPAEAARRQREFGPNRIEAVRAESTVAVFVRGFSHFLALILWVAAALAFFAETQAPGEGMALLGSAIIGVILINGLFSFWQEYRAEQSFAALARLLPQNVQGLRGGIGTTLPRADLVPGDIIVLTGGDSVPADCRIIEAYGARVSNATITGEAAALPRDAAPATGDERMQARNVLLAGTALISGEVKAVVFATGMHTEFGQIARLTQTTRAVASPMQREIAHLSRLIALFASALGVVLFLVGRQFGLPFWDSLLFGIGIIVANVPEGLLPTVTLALAMGSQRMARRGVLIRHLPAVETLGCATVICTDKTGTLTLNRLEAQQLFLDGVLGDCCPPAERIAAHRRFFLAALHCHSLNRDGKGEPMGDPLDVALARMARRALPDAQPQERLFQIPFDSERRRMTTLHREAGDRVLYVKGALEALLPLTTAVHIRAAQEPLTPERAEELRRAEGAMAEQGLRVLALAYREVPTDESTDRLERELVLAGLVGFRDPPRPEVPGAIAACRSAGVKVIMVTGDHPQTALAIAREIGLVHAADPRILTGDRLAHFSDAALQLALDAPEILFARASADQKLRIVRALQRKGETVVATGDGVNDAPALRQADIGIAMGRAGTDVAREAADMVLLDDNFAAIAAAIEEGRGVYDNVRKFMTYILSSNVPEIIPYLAFVLFRIPLPLTVVQILAVDLGTDLLPALALGAERPEPDVMHRPPRPRSARLLNRRLLLRAYGFLGLIEAAAAMSLYFLVLRAGGWPYGQPLTGDDPLYLRATTACLAAIVVMQIVNVFLCRREHESIFSREQAGNRFILVGIGVEVLVIMLIVYTPSGNALFGTASLDASVWLASLPFAFGMLVLEEVRKAWVRTRAR